MGAPDLCQPPRLHDRDSVAEEQGFDHVVGDEDSGHAELPAELLKRLLEPIAGQGIQGAEGLIEQEDLRLRGQCPRDPHSLALATRELVRPTRDELGRLQLEQGEQLAYSRLLLAGAPGEQVEGDGHILPDGHVREEADLLEAVPDAAPQLEPLQGSRIRSGNSDRAGRGLDEPVDQLQRGGLAASRASQQHEKLSTRDLQREVLNREGRTVGFGEAIELDQMGESMV